MRKTCLDLVWELAQQDARICFVGSDLGVGTLKEFHNAFPDRCFMEGVSEAHVVGMAAGLALEGRIVYVNTIATFLTRRCYEQVALDACLHKANIRLIGNGGGLVYAPLGPTHEATDDLALLRVLPNMTVVAPADAQEMRRLMPATVDHAGPLYIRLGKGGEPITTRPEPFVIGRGYVMREGPDLLLVSTGVLLEAALQASRELAVRGVDVTVLHLPTVKPLDADLLLAHATGKRLVVTVEEHFRMGGFGSAVLECLADAGHPSAARTLRLGLPDAFPDQYGSQASLLARYGLDAPGMVQSILAKLES